MQTKRRMDTIAISPDLHPLYLWRSAFAAMHFSERLSHFRTSFSSFPIRQTVHTDGHSIGSLLDAHLVPRTVYIILNMMYWFIIKHYKLYTALWVEHKYSKRYYRIKLFWKTHIFKYYLILCFFFFFNGINFYLYPFHSCLFFNVKHLRLG